MMGLVVTVDTSVILAGYSFAIFTCCYSVVKMIMRLVAAWQEKGKTKVKTARAQYLVLIYWFAQMRRSNWNVTRNSSRLPKLDLSATPLTRNHNPSASIKLNACGLKEVSSILKHAIFNSLHTEHMKVWSGKVCIDECSNHLDEHLVGKFPMWVDTFKCIQYNILTKPLQIFMLIMKRAETPFHGNWGLRNKVNL